jgi:hypothetical protein
LALCAARLRAALSARQRLTQHRAVAITFLIAFAFSSAFLYSIVHEFGHLAVGMLFGGKPGDVTWTLLAGVEPHVSFKTQPSYDWGLIAAGGVLLPSAAGLMLVGLWLLIGRRFSPIASALLLAPGVSLLFGGMGATAEVLSDPGNGHLDGLAQAIHLHGAGRVFLYMLPALITLSAYAVLFKRLRPRTPKPHGAHHEP